MGGWVQMEINSGKSPRLYAIFLCYLTLFFLATVLSASAFCASFFLGLSNGTILPANFAEQEIIKVRDVLAQSEPFDKSAVPYTCYYGLFDVNNNFTSGNLNEQQIEQATYFLKNDNILYNNRYIPIKRQYGYCVIKYDIKAHFSSALLNKILPNPEFLTILLFLVTFIILVIITAVTFGRKLKKELSPLIIATNNIKKQNLDFEVSPTNIKEFNEVLCSINEMKIALKQSLEEQWVTVQKKQTQLSALAHDIKTPLTIIKGNAELLQETNLSNEMIEYVGYIAKNTNKIEQYLVLLMETAQAENEVAFKRQSVNINGFLVEFLSQANLLAITKSISIVFEKHYLSETIDANSSLLERALLNILSNAIDYSPNDSEIKISVIERKDKFHFTIIDCGSGFSDTGLKNASDHFYMEQGARTSNTHYGMGLFIAKTVALKHNGNLILENRTDRHGAKVTLIISKTNTAL